MKKHDKAQISMKMFQAIKLINYMILLIFVSDMGKEENEQKKPSFNWVNEWVNENSAN